jgi:uncharacterized membrane protein
MRTPTTWWFLCLCLSFAVGLRLPMQLNCRPPTVLSRIKATANKLMTPQSLASSAAWCCALILGVPVDVSGSPSGTRRGGASFRTAARKYSSSSFPSPRIDPFNAYSFPTLSPFSYRMQYTPTVSVSPIVVSNTVASAGMFLLVYFFVWQMLRHSGASTNYADDSSASVTKIQIALDADWTQPGNVMETLSGHTSSGSTDGRVQGGTNMALLLSEAALTLLRKKDSWTAASVEEQKFHGSDAVRRAEPSFQSSVVQERSKFHTEVAPTASATGSTTGVKVDKRSFKKVLGSTLEVASPSKASRDSTMALEPLLVGEAVADSGGHTKAVVSLVVATRGQTKALPGRAPAAAEIAKCLQTLSAEALSNDGNNVLGVEVLWVPAERGHTLKSQDLLLNYPELVSL